MATKFYFRCSGSSSITPVEWHSSWNKTGETGPFLLSTSKGGTPFAEASNTALDNSTDEFIAIGQWISNPIEEQTINGTLRGVIACSQNSSQLNSTLAITAYICKSDGGMRGTLCSTQASDDITSIPPELSNFMNTRRFQNTDEDTDIILSSVNTQKGDAIVIEIGYREVNINTARFASIRFGDASETDHSFFDGESDLFNPWIEFSQNIEFVGPFQSEGVDKDFWCNIKEIGKYIVVTRK